MEDNLLTIKEVAAIAGVTNQAIYKRLRKENSDIAKFAVEKNGKKYLRKEVLDIIEEKPTPEKSEVEVLREMVDMMKNQITMKDAQISSLQVQNEQLITANRQLTIALESTTESLRAAQALHAGTLQQQILEPEATPTPEAANSKEESAPPETIKETEQEKTEDKKGFFARLFGW